MEICFTPNFIYISHMHGMLMVVKVYSFGLGMELQQNYNGMNIQVEVIKNMSGTLIVGSFLNGYLMRQSLLSVLKYLELHLEMRFM